MPLDLDFHILNFRFRKGVIQLDLDVRMLSILIDQLWKSMIQLDLVVRMLSFPLRKDVIHLDFEIRNLKSVRYC